MNNKYLLYSFTFINLFLIHLASATTINIPADYTSIQEGINAAQNGDTILVDEGTYYENINFRGKNIVVASRYLIDGNYSHINNTIIDGSQSTEPDTGSCVIFGSGEGSGAVITGFTITGGTGTNFDFGGGAVFREGGGIIMNNSSATIKNNLIINNESKIVPNALGGGGGGISSMFGNPQVLNNIIMQNTASYAAGMVLNWSAGTVRNNLIYKNSGGGQYGTGGLMVWESPSMSAIVENNTIVENVSLSTAGGLSVQNTDANIRNNIIWGNTQQSGTQVTGYQTSIFEYCNTEETYPGTGNISQSPDFYNVGFLLNDNSPCVDAGNPEPNFDDVEDPTNPGFALYPSLGELRNDIGAYGGPGAELLPDISGIVGVRQSDIDQIPNSIILYQNYPNPFNPATNIRYEILERSLVTVKVYDVLGNEVITLVNEEESAGEYEIEFDGTGLTSGIYFYQCDTGSFVETKMMILLK
jgi:hypothetical protein